MEKEYLKINDDPETAPHTLFSIRHHSTNTDSKSNGVVEQETLDIRLFFDTSILEVFINERVAITTRIYPESGKCFGVRPFAKYLLDDERHRFTGSSSNFDSGGVEVELRGEKKALVLDCVGWELQPSVAFTV
jgi:beta-fructofuranosidase